MSNDQIPMTNAQRRLRSWSLVLGHWSFLVSHLGLRSQRELFEAYFLTDLDDLLHHAGFGVLVGADDDGGVLFALILRLQQVLLGLEEGPDRFGVGEGLC